MVKKKTSQVQQESCPKEVKLKNLSGLSEWDPVKELMNKSFILDCIKECLLEGDPSGAAEVFLIYVRACNRARLAKESNISKSTIEHCLQHCNPTMETMFKLLSA